MKTSDKILLGIFNHWPRLDDDISFETGELAWIIYHGLNNWRMDNGWKKIEYPIEKGANDRSFLDEPLRDTGKVGKELSVLQANGYVEFTRPSGLGMHFKVKLLPQGLLRAEKLSTWPGRIELWYSEHKNGIFGLVVTVIVSIITAWITSKLITKWG